MLFDKEVLFLTFYSGCTFCGFRMAINSTCLDSKRGVTILLRCYCNKMKNVRATIEMVSHAKYECFKKTDRFRFSVNFIQWSV